MKHTPPSPTALRVADLSPSNPITFNVRPEADELKSIAAELELSALRKLSFSGDVRAEGKADWRLSAKLGATVIQPCAVTLEPVTTRIDMPVSRLYQHDFVEVDAPESEMPEDDTTDRLGRWIDPADVMLEALQLAIPLYPRADGAELGEMVVTEPGVSPMRDEDSRPFAGLAELKASLEAKKQR